MDEVLLRQHVEALAGTPRVPGTPEHEKAIEYIRDEFKSLLLPTQVVVESDGSKNIVAVAGNPRMPCFVVGAHYDSVPGSPGADDNASGVAALLEIASVYKPYKKPQHMSFEKGAHHVQFVAYDCEEDGLLGSAAHCRRLQQGGVEVLGMMSLEMLGYTSPNQKFVEGISIPRTEGDFLAIVSNPKSVSLLKLFQGIESPLPYDTLTVPRGTEAAMLSRLSDHGSFWDAGWNALLLTDTAFLRNPHYHQPTDTPATLDYTFLRHSAELVSKALKGLVNIA